MDDARDLGVAALERLGVDELLDQLGRLRADDVTADELAYLARVSELFGQSPLVFRRLRATHLGPEAGDPYAVLGVAHDASDAQLRLAWRAMLAEAHPDRARARGLPAEFIEVAEAKAGYSVTLAPLAVKDKIIVGVGGGEYGIRGFVAAYDARSGREVWRFYTIPAPGEPRPPTAPPPTITWR